MPTLNLPQRLRRNRTTEAIRNLLRETHLHPHDFIAPLFIQEGHQIKTPIRGMPGVHRLSIDLAIEEAKKLHFEGIQALLLFPVIPKELKSFSGEEAWNRDGLLARAISEIKSACPQMCLFADVALDPYTTHGHDGLLDEKGVILNDPTIDCLIEMSLMQARAGIDFVAPSDMMDGRVQSIRKALDQEGFSHVGILSYSAKYASCFYGPFRSALNVEKLQGDKKTYQMDPANQKEALLEAALDEKEGADILMIKPATLYLDVIAKVKEKSLKPIAAYHVSGEYAMVMAAHSQGLLDAKAAFLETLTAIKRAGADLICTYATPLILEEYARI